MKSRILFFAAAMISMIAMAYSQSSEREINKEFYKADAQISIIINYLPKGWVFTAEGNKFFITSPDSAWVLEDKTPGVKESKETRVARIQQNGEKILPRVIIRYEDKWTAEKIQLAKIENASIDDEIRKLPAKYHIQHMADTVKSSKQKTIYTATNEKEIKLLAQYENQLQQLLAQRIVLPDFHTEKYSLYIDKITGAADETHLVYPGDVSLNIYTVLSTFREVCGK